MTIMTRSDVEYILTKAREAGVRPDLMGLNLSGLDLRGLDLQGANLSMSNLYGADLGEADLSMSSLYGAILCEADLTWADLTWANLSRADLTEASLGEADLSRANLYGANLYGANLSDVILRKSEGILSLGDTPSGPAYLHPLPDGTWLLTVGCWSGTSDDLRALAAGDDYPSGCDAAERERRRPILMSLADQADTLAARHHDWLTTVVKTWE